MPNNMEGFSDLVKQNSSECGPAVSYHNLARFKTNCVSNKGSYAFQVLDRRNN